MPIFSQNHPETRFSLWHLPKSRFIVATTIYFLLTGLSLHGEDQPATVNTAIVPVPKLENDSYDWHARHEEILKRKDSLQPEIVMIGDSITHFWGGNPDGRSNGPTAWKVAFGDRRVLNIGFGWDRTQNVLWRLKHGEFDGLTPQWVILNIGTNNLTGTGNARENSPAEIMDGIAAICDLIQAKSPNTKIIHMAVFPRGRDANDAYRPKIAEVNRLLAIYAAKHHRTFIDLGSKLTTVEGRIPEDIMGDACHPTDKGYAVWAEALNREFDKVE